jgi:predicted RNase H-like HicB family nuclease
MLKKATRRRRSKTASAVRTYTAHYTKVDSGYMGQLVEWPQVVTEGKTLEECREMLRDALNEMLIVYREDGFEIPDGTCLLEPIPIEL